MSHWIKTFKSDSFARIQDPTKLEIIKQHSNTT